MIDGLELHEKLKKLELEPMVPACLSCVEHKLYCCRILKRNSGKARAACGPCHVRKKKCRVAGASAVVALASKPPPASRRPNRLQPRMRDPANVKSTPESEDTPFPAADDGEQEAMNADDEEDEIQDWDVTKMDTDDNIEDPDVDDESSDMRAVAAAVTPAASFDTSIPSHDWLRGKLDLSTISVDELVQVGKMVHDAAMSAHSMGLAITVQLSQRKGGKN